MTCFILGHVAKLPCCCGDLMEYISQRGSQPAVTPTQMIAALRSTSAPLQTDAPPVLIKNIPLERSKSGYLRALFYSC